LRALSFYGAVYQGLHALQIIKKPSTLLSLLYHTKFTVHFLSFFKKLKVEMNKYNISMENKMKGSG